MAGLAGLTAFAWLGLWLRGDGMEMGALAPRLLPWRLADLGAAAVMWATMMVAMMLPSAAPVLLLFSGAQRKRKGQAAKEAARLTALFAFGYLVVWFGWSLLAAALQWALQGLLLLSPHLAATSLLLSAAFLLLAGLYQFTPLKAACLVQCQSPLGFLLARWREGRWGALGMGLHHGAYCVGCCWALMGLLFVGGVMNLLWVAALAGFILLEKAVARGPWLSRATGLVLIGWGLYVLQSGLAS
ncbi:MAG: DUF2182 domain-containing protein [Candidatus Rokubacteria bacterium]|nr:DUF2182 domain-containing protein [Candidatus Rokubacteria bacterium]